MARILFAWELGGDYGHLARLLPVAMELARRGHFPVFAVRELLGAEAILGPHGLRWFQAPLWTGQLTNLPDPISYAELLMRVGFLNPQALTGICRAWRNLIELLGADLLVLDHAPTALLASRGLGLPRVNLGDGFCIPPATRPLPPFRWWQRENLARLQDSERHAWMTANEVLFALDGPPLASLAELLACDAALFCGFAELDHYPDRAPAEFIGPIFALGQGAMVEWPATEKPRLFAYLKAGYGPLEQALQALARLDASVIAHVPGASRKTVSAHASEHFVFSADPVDIEHMRTSCDLAVCHGGAGTTAAMLLAGKPLFLLPMHMEQTMTARRLASLGVAAAATPDQAGQLPKLLKQALAQQAMREAARAFADRHADHDQQDGVRRAADRCENLLGATAR